jgi:hypothetical protein
MGQIILYAVLSSVFPALLAGVAVLLSRDKPAKLMVAFWIGGFTTSCIAGFLIISAFGEKASSLGDAGHNLAPPYSIGAGIGALLIAGLLGTKRGRLLIDNWRERRSEKKAKKPDKEPWAERVLNNGSIAVAAGAGAVLNLPGPFYLLALGDLATKHYSAPLEIGVIVLFNLIMLMLVELPIIGFMFNPEKTDRWVGEFSKWLNSHGMTIVAVIAFGFGLSLIGKGIHDALDPAALAPKSSSLPYSASSSRSVAMSGKNFQIKAAPRAIASIPTM